MSYLTRSNIAYDLNISPHSATVDYDNGSIRFIFSSNLYKEKFLERLQDNREKINESLSNRFGMNVDVPILCDLKLYTTIEKRGFLIFKDGVKIEWLNDITLDGLRMITKR